MPKNKEPQWKIEGLREEEIFDQIRYLDPDTNCEGSRNDSNAVICLGLLILLSGLLAFVWIYRS